MQKRKRKPMVSIYFTNAPMTDWDKSFICGKVMGVLMKHKRDAEAKAFYAACKPTKKQPVNISSRDFVYEASKYVYFKLNAI